MVRASVSCARVVPWVVLDPGSGACGWPGVLQRCHFHDGLVWLGGVRGDCQGARRPWHDMGRFVVECVSWLCVGVWVCGCVCMRVYMGCWMGCALTLFALVRTQLGVDGMLMGAPAPGQPHPLCSCCPCVLPLVNRYCFKRIISGTRASPQPPRLVQCGPFSTFCNALGAVSCICVCVYAYVCVCCVCVCVATHFGWVAYPSLMECCCCCGLYTDPVFPCPYLHPLAQRPQLRAASPSVRSRALAACAQIRTERCLRAHARGLTSLTVCGSRVCPVALPETAGIAVSTHASAAAGALRAAPQTRACRPACMSLTGAPPCRAVTCPTCAAHRCVLGLRKVTRIGDAEALRLCVGVCLLCTRWVRVLRGRGRGGGGLLHGIGRSFFGLYPVTRTCCVGCRLLVRTHFTNPHARSSRPQTLV